VVVVASRVAAGGGVVLLQVGRRGGALRWSRRSVRRTRGLLQVGLVGCCSLRLELGGVKLG